MCNFCLMRSAIQENFIPAGTVVIDTMALR
jgi:hypothetical protein